MNNWKSCKKNPPPMYKRIEIKCKDGSRCIGYRYDKDYYETYGNYLIKNPMWWRFPPEGSALVTELLEKLHIFPTIEAQSLIQDQGGHNENL